ncbi:rhodanese-like domain-containing protein [Chitinophagaceae bacterium LB-8]|uniref:Rhodanese-like domain-containing protein n=1 Tax=Paraflavisolibacter caeni TaxID=2982496 RepID=A0A9X2XNZ0_9BACT|nr:rhodanese-like domain-containing protein [Paraflavisolibacter caeni]MCU7550003.1 rhodanese-like domain-containing protein [Paraflavisolibacter caeni]
MKTITVDELKQKMDRGERINLLDVREPQEYAEVNIGGRLVPLGKVQTMQVDELEDWKDEEVIVYCRSGRRSMLACLVLDQMGFKETYNLEGGILAWLEKYKAEESKA